MPFSVHRVKGKTDVLVLVVDNVCERKRVSKRFDEESALFRFYTYPDKDPRDNTK